jgi:hypothetical protein
MKTPAGDARSAGKTQGKAKAKAAAGASKPSTPAASSRSRPTSAAKAKVGTKRKAVTSKSRPKPKASANEHEPSRQGRNKVVLLSGGNPQIAKGYGDAPVQAYIAAMPGWKSDLGKRLDALIVRTLPKVRKAVKWNSPFYGIEGRGWFLSLHVFARYVKLAFFRGTSLRPVPPGPSKHQEVRYLDIYENDELDEPQLARWVKQAAALPGGEGLGPPP